LPPRKFIPLEAAEEVFEGPMPFTDVVIALYFEGLPSDFDEEDEQVFESAPLAEAVIGAFCLGCAIGIEYPERLLPILTQTHGDDLDEIVADCRASLTERINEAKAATEPIEAESFILEMTDGLDERPYASAETAQNALSMAFEYGCVLAHVERGAAIVVRNEFNRSQQEIAEEMEDEGSSPDGEALDPYHSVQEFAEELVTAYEADIVPLA
jgi:hypothetical protein